MDIYAVLVKYEEMCEEATAWHPCGEEQTKVYCELCATIRPHVCHQTRDHYSSEELKSLVIGTHRGVQGVPRGERRGRLCV